MTIPPPDKTPDKTVEWAALAAHAREAALDIPALLKDSDRTGRMVLTGADFTVFDFTHHRASHETMRLLHDFARARDVAGACTAMMAGRVVNPTENRPAWHTALRDPAPPAPVRGMLDGMRAFVNRIRADKSVTDVIHVGIGGSILGTQLVCDALRAEADGPRIHFIAGYDATERHPLLERLDPAATLVVAASKTFTTLETRFNLDCLKNWLGPARAGRIAAATANPQAAREAGVDDANILAF
ncbi:MAG: glucose-6-phosphate isomerase, partial [Alphaproteobacteria bacterium]|nr:glucose-6-phosphate isomerase [Alphaproteobacteria bacterium]